MTSVDADLDFIDFYCGIGGSTLGLVGAGWTPRLAVNHWDRAIEIHSMNFDGLDHWCADTQAIDMRRLPRARVLWASPICTEMSPAGGQKKKRGAAGQGALDLEELGHISQPAYERTRVTFYEVTRATEVWRYDAILIENVVDVARDWELFDWWVEGMKRLGYNVQYASISTAHIGGDGNAYAPQWRDRLYLVFTKVGIPLPDLEPRPLAWCGTCGRDTHALQSWKKDVGARRIGKYRQQYVYVCERSECRHARVEPYVLPAAAAIDWSDLGERIGDKPRKKAHGQPLAPKTMARIEAGLREFARPIVAQAAGNTFERYAGMRTVPADGAPIGAVTGTAEKALASPPVMLSVNHDGEDARAYPADSRPLPSRTVKIGDGFAVPPITVPAGGTWRDDAAPVDDAPMGARTTRDTDGLVCPPFMAELRGTSSVRPVLGEPLGAVTASGNHHGLTIPLGSFYVRNFGHTEPKHLVHPVSDPLGVITAKDHHSLVIPYYRTGRAKDADDAPLDTVTTHDRFGLLEHPDPDVAPFVDVMDCRFRMLKWREHMRAQRFPDTYRTTGNAGELTMGAGNAVSANVAQFIGSRVAEVLERVA